MLTTQQPLLQRLGKALRVQSDGIVQEPLPDHWIELVNDLNKRDRKQPETTQCDADPSSSRTDRAHSFHQMSASD